MIMVSKYFYLKIFIYLNNFQGTTLNTYIKISTILSILFLAFCIPINVAIVWAYRSRRQQLKSQQSTTTATHGNMAAKAKADRIERRLLLFAILTFFGHVLMSIMLVSILILIVINAKKFGNSLLEQKIQ
jgi:hypothetical protein